MPRHASGRRRFEIALLCGHRRGQETPASGEGSEDGQRRCGERILAKQDISIRTDDGTAKAGLFHPGHQPVAGVILYRDAFGPRPALDTMAERLAGEGYGVLVPDLFYRFGDYGPLDARTAFSEEPTRSALRGMIDGTSQDMTRRDSAAFLDALTQ